MGLGRDLRQTTHSTGLFFQNEWRSDRFSLLVGGRLDKHNLMRNVVFSPRVNLRYTPREEVGLRLSYSSGYRAPQAYNEDLHIDALDNKVSLIELAPGLRPEYSHSVSGSVDLYHSFGRVQTNLLVEASDAAGRRLHARENRQTPRATSTASGATARGRPSPGERRAEGGHPGPLRGAGGLHLPAQPLHRARAVVQRGDPAAAHVPSDHYGYLTASYTPVRALCALALRHLRRTMLVQHNAGYIAADTERITPRSATWVRVWPTSSASRGSCGWS